MPYLRKIIKTVSVELHQTQVIQVTSIFLIIFDKSLGKNRFI